MLGHTVGRILRQTRSAYLFSAHWFFVRIVFIASIVRSSLSAVQKRQQQRLPLPRGRKGPGGDGDDDLLPARLLPDLANMFSPAALLSDCGQVVVVEAPVVRVVPHLGTAVVRGAPVRQRREQFRGAVVRRILERIN